MTLTMLMGSIMRIRKSTTRLIFSTSFASRGCSPPATGDTAAGSCFEIAPWV